MKGRFIVFEGIDGAGKTTHLRHVVDALAAQGMDVVATREPGGTPLGETLRSLLLNEAMQPTTELMLMFAARREHLEQKIWPALAKGQCVVCDRFTAATRAYQGYGRELGEGVIDTLADLTHPNFAPDLTLWFDSPVALAASRVASGRDDRDRFEREQTAFFERVRAGYAAQHASDPARFVRIDSSGALPEVRAAVERALAEAIARWAAEAAD